jgi:hypothetical protein
MNVYLIKVLQDQKRDLPDESNAEFMQPAMEVPYIKCEDVEKDGSWTLCTVCDKPKDATGRMFKCVLPSYVQFNPYIHCKRR